MSTTIKVSQLPEAVTPLVGDEEVMIVQSATSRRCTVDDIAGAASVAFANPTGTVGLTAVNGALSTALRSDSAPALSQSIAPTWTGIHTFSNTVALNGTTTVSGTSIRDAALITSGTMATARLGSGSATSSTYLRGDSTWQTIAATTPAGSDTQIQFNNAGAFGADADFTFDQTTNIVTLGSTATAGILRGGAGSGATGATLTVRGGAGGTSNNGGSTVVEGGPAGSTGTGGSLTLRGGNPTDGVGGSVTVSGRDGSGTNRAGGATTISAGQNTGNGAAGTIFISGSTAAGSATGGTVVVTGGQGASGGTAGGQVSMTGGVAGAGGGAGGAALVTGGAAVGAGAGGSVTVRGGLGGATSGAGGTAALIAGAPQEGNGGLATVTGTAGVGTNRAGGAANITAGDATGNATGGSVTLTAGTSPSGTLGSITVVTGGSTRFAIDGAGAWQVGGSPGTSTNILTSNGSGTPPTWQAAPSGASGANPSAMVGLLGVNGVATTFLRSDGAPALDQNITPTWTGTHTFSSNVALNGTTTVSGTSINAAGLITSGTMATARLGSGSATANTLLHGNSTWSAVSLSADVTGNLPVANLNSGTSASSSTFWRGDATWASPGGAAITGSFTGTLTGMSGATTGTVNYSVTNGIATLWTTGAGITGTSDANTFTMTGLAGAVTPAVASSGITFAQNNSVTAFCGADVSTGGVITFNLSNVAATSGPVTFGGSLWTSSGTKGLSGAWQFSYALK